MPIYEYQCEDCEQRVELFVRSPGAGSERATCPECGGRRLKRLFSGFATSAEPSFPGYAALDDVDSEDPESVAAWQQSAGSGAADEL